MSEQDAAEPDDVDVAESTEGDDGDTDEPEDADNAFADIVAYALPDEEDESATTPSPEELTVEEGFVERIQQAEPTDTARCLAVLRERVDTLEGQLDAREEELDDLESRLKRKQAEFQNYKKRQKERMETEKQRATEDTLEGLLDVRDNLARALDQDEDVDIRGGVETTLRQFDEQLEREGVDRIDPQPGEDVDPQRHEALATVASDQPENTVAQVHRPGYAMAGSVIRPAQVAVSDGSADEAGDS